MSTPTAKKMSIDQNPIEVYCCSAWKMSGNFERLGTLALIAASPMKSTTKPMRNSAMFL